MIYTPKGARCGICGKDRLTATKMLGDPDAFVCYGCIDYITRELELPKRFYGITFDDPAEAKE